MNPSFSSHLINDVFGDPGVFVEIRWSRRALLFDLGHNDSLGPTRLLRATDSFISHTHMDHFIGFDAVLRVAGHRVGRRAVLPSGLTRREADVLVLLARGMSNPEIASELTISRKTVSSHLEHIYTKIGVNTRTEAALFAMRTGLVDAIAG